VTLDGVSHAPKPLPHQRAPPADHRQADAHEPHRSASDAHGTARPRICQATASPAPAQDIARRILGEDVTQIDYTTERVKRMVGRVLTGNGITRYGDGRYTLVSAEELSDSKRDALLQLCRQRLDGFREQGGEEVYCFAEAFGYAHRSRHRSPISGSVKVRITIRPQGSASTTWSNCRARAGMLSETICQMVSSSRPK
jgi:hypothetical protein